MKPNRTDWMLRLSSDHWSLVSTTDREETPVATGQWMVTDAAAVVEQIDERLTEQQLAPGPLLVAIDSSLCLAAHFTVASSRHLRKREALLFQLEEILPLSAEEVVADFIIEQRSVFAVVAETAILEALVVELTRGGFSVEAIVPEVVLALEQHLRTGTWPLRHGVLWLEREQWEFVIMDGGKPIAWERLPAHSTALLESLRAGELKSSAPLPLVAYGQPELIAEVKSQITAAWLSASDDAEIVTLGMQAGQTTTRVLDEQIDPPLQLVRGAIAASIRRKNPLRLEWRLLQSAAALLLLTLAAEQFQGWQRAQQELAAHVAGQADVFRELYPDKRIPVGFQTRLASDLRRLRGVRGETAELPSSSESLAIVQQVLAALPTDMRFRLLEIRVENGRLSLSGEVRSHGDADRIAAALRKQGLRASSPSTQQLPQQGVDFRLTAEVAPPQENSA